MPPGAAILPSLAGTPREHASISPAGGKAIPNTPSAVYAARTIVWFEFPDHCI